MNPLSEIGKFLIAAGLLMAVAGIIMILLPKLPFIGRLPGDILIKRGNFTFYFPVATSIILSIVLTIIFSIFRK